jgi:hypothetical protein
MIQDSSAITTSMHAISESKIMHYAIQRHLFPCAVSLCFLLSACGGAQDQAQVNQAAVPPAPPAAAPSSDALNFNGIRNNYSITRTDAGFVVRDLVGNDGAILVSQKSLLHFADFSVNLVVGDKSKTISADRLKSLIELYIAFFNRVPDADGMSYWIDQIAAGMTNSQLANNFYTAAIQYSDVTGYSPNLSNVDFVKIIYKNVLGRSGATAPPDEDVNYWAGELSSGRSSKGNLVDTMLNSAHSYQGDPQWGWVPQLLDNKVIVGRYFALEQALNYNTDELSISKGIEIAAAVTATNTANAKAAVGVTDTQLNMTTGVTTPSITSLQSMRAGADPDPAIPTLTLQDVLGSYHFADNQNDAYGIGTLAIKAGTTDALKWTPKAGSGFGLQADLSKGILITGTDNPYRSINPMSALNFVLQFQNKKLVGFRYNDNLYLKDGVDALTMISPGLHSYFNAGSDPASIPANYTYGYSMYTAIWPLFDKPIHGFQAGMPGTWLNPDNEDFFQPLLPADHPMRISSPNDTTYWRGLFQSIEGSGGYWISTHFASKSQKYRFGATPNGYVDQLFSSGWGVGTDAAAPGTNTGGKYALALGTQGGAQLSNHLLLPPDGLTFKEGTSGEFFGVAWMALPLIPARAGNVPIGNQSWTMFANAVNFQGPVMFYIPDLWEIMAQSYPTIIGRGLDVRPGISKNLAMEMNSMPYFKAKDKSGVDYIRMPRLTFPTDDKGLTYLLTDYTLYSGAALFQPFMDWINGGAAISGKFASAGAVAPKMSANSIYMWGDNAQMQSDQGLSDLIEPITVATPKGGTAWAFQWKGAAINGVFPEYYKRQGDYFIPVTAAQVPDETGLKGAPFSIANADGWSGTAYKSPSNWSTPSPAAGPFTTRLNDGSTVTYSWYRFIDQPSLQGFGWSDAIKSNLQAAVERIHINWKNQLEFMAPPSIGNLATLDSGLLVTPPKGLEIGYVPIVIKQNN